MSEKNEMNQDPGILREENEHLTWIEEILHREFDGFQQKLDELMASYIEAQEYKKKNYTELDGREHLQLEREIRQIDTFMDMEAAGRLRISKLIDSPYFARIDFTPDDGEPPLEVYIGRFGFEQDHELLIFDWRAPICSMFYDYETGSARYLAPGGVISGLMTKKRQYKIEDGRIIFALDNSETVSDDVLQQELSKTSDEKMKTIIATIQREQNHIIRNERSKTMIIQGVAGSGKTSIALHRVAFLLYRFRENIKSENILILSPNKAFADYISGVIPELGEEPIVETGFYDLAVDALDNVIDFEDERDPLDVEDEGWLERMRFKSTPEFLEQLREYERTLPERVFQPRDYVRNDKVLPASWIKEQFLFYKNVPIMERIPTVAGEVVEELLYVLGPGHELPKATAMANTLRSRLTLKTPAALYRDFYRSIGRTDMLFMDKNKLEWPDVYPFMHLWHAYHGLERNLHIKHLVVDEMQDYTPIQYDVLNMIYPCQKTILGDFSQSLNPRRAYTVENLRACFPGAEYVEMNKSFRSTQEIMRFAQGISPCPSMEPLDRHGPVPEVFLCETEDREIQRIAEFAERFRSAVTRPVDGAPAEAKGGASTEAKEGLTGGSLGIILKNTKEAKRYFELLQPCIPGLTLLSPTSTEYTGGLLVTSVSMAKGLEFDEVIVPAADEAHYSREEDRNLLYVACTRAMHRLTVTGVRKRSPLIP